MADTAEIIEAPQSEVAVQQGHSLIRLIETALARPELDMDKLERFLEMQRNVERDQAEKTFNEEFAIMQPLLPAVEKRGAGHNSKYAKWEDIQEAVLPVTSAHGFGIMHKTRVEGEIVIVTCVLRHREGHQEITELPLPFDKSGNKNNIQAMGSSVSYGKRYTACALLGIRVEGEDSDAEGEPPKKNKPTRDLYEAMQNELRECMNLEALAEWDADQQKAGNYDKLPEDWFNNLRDEYQHRKGMHS